MSQLDCNTARGKGYIECQMSCLKALEAAMNVQMIMTPEDEAAGVDALAVRVNRVVAVLEVKSREMDLAQLNRFGSYLITFEKLLKIRTVSASLCVPGFVAVSLLKEDAPTVLMWKVCDERGNLVASLEARVSQTQATCNGGQADRYNAYLSMREAEVVV